MDLVKKEKDEWYQYCFKSQNQKAFKNLLRSCYKQRGTSTKANHLHIFKVKYIENLLSTVRVLNIQKPNIYRDNIYKRCSKESESNKHIIYYEKAQEALAEISTEVQKKIQVDKRKEEKWDFQKLKQILFKITEEEKQLQSTEQLQEILNTSDAERLKK